MGYWHGHKDEVVGPFRVEDGLKINSQSSGTGRSASSKKTMIFMQNDAPSHASKYSTSWLASKGIKDERIMTWPPSSPDLNPVENLWALLKQDIYSAGCGCCCTKVDHQQIKKLTNFMNGRLMTLTENKGGYWSLIFLISIKKSIIKCILKVA